MRQRSESPKPAPQITQTQEVEREALLIRITDLQREIETFAREFPDATFAEHLLSPLSRLDACLKDIEAARGAILKQRKAEEERQVAEAKKRADAADDVRLAHYMEKQIQSGAYWSGADASEALDIPLSLLAYSALDPVRTLLEPPPELAAAWKRWQLNNTATIPSNIPPIEVREALTAGERAIVDGLAREEECSSQDAADELGVSVGTFRKHAAAAGLRPVNYYVTRAGYEGALYSLYDVLSLRSRIDRGAVARAAARRMAEVEALRGDWAKLNERQRRYFDVIWDAYLDREEVRRDRDMRSSIQTPWVEEPDGWRWLYHDEWGGHNSLATRLAPLGLLGTGAGSTYAALEERGLLIRRYTSIEIESLRWGRRTEPILWVMLTPPGRKLGRAMREFPEKFPLEVAEPESKPNKLKQARKRSCLTISAEGAK